MAGCYWTFLLHNLSSSEMGAKGAFFFIILPFQGNVLLRQLALDCYAHSVMCLKQWITTKVFILAISFEINVNTLTHCELLASSFLFVSSFIKVQCIERYVSMKDKSHKGIVHLKMKILSSVVPNLYFFCWAEKILWRM